MSDPIAIDYTSRDYTALRQDLINQIPLKLPEWTDHSTNDFGIALLELFAYVGDIMNYYGDRIANEAYLQTATQRANVLTIARMLDYTPGGNVGAQVTLTMTNNGGTTQLVPAGTQVSTATGDVIFETNTAVTVVGGGGTNTVVATQGVTVSAEAVGTSDGTLNQDFTLFQTPVIDNSVQVFVNTGSGPVKWTYIEHLIDGEPTSQIFNLYTDASGVVHVVFGDNVNGLVPAQGAIITSTYRTGGGTIGNVGAGTLIRYVTAVAAGMTVTNAAAAAGGANAETLDSIRVNAPKSLFSLQRAVTLDDYNQLAIRVAGVAKANTVASVYSSPTVYIAPAGGGGVVAGSPTTQFAATQTAVGVYLASKVPATVTVTVGQPVYVPITVTLSIQVLNNYSQDSVYTAVVAALNNYFFFDNVSFGQRVTLADLYSTVMSVPGVQYLTPTVLSRTGAGLADIVLAANEIPTSSNAGATTISVTASGGIITT